MCIEQALGTTSVCRFRNAVCNARIDRARFSTARAG